jgi:hypothetical protein
MIGNASQISDTLQKNTIPDLKAYLRKLTHLVLKLSRPGDDADWNGSRLLYIYLYS